MKSSLARLLEGGSLTRSEAELLMSRMVDGEFAPEQVGAFLVALRLKPESAEEISGFVDALRKRAVDVRCELEGVMDVCGTGGDSLGTFNVSTTVAFVTAAAGQPIAKHGNRSVSSRSGSFDVLEALGIRFETDPAAVSRSIDEHGIGLIFAPAFHPSLKAFAGLRKSLGVHTVFNILGPLLNPVRLKRQLVGVFSPRLLEKVADVLKSQDLEEAMVVRGEDGLDEISLSGPTRIARLRGGIVESMILRPEDFGVARAPLEAIRGGDARENAEILLKVLGGELGPRRDMVLINASAALVAGGRAGGFEDGMERAAEAIDSGRALELVRRLGAKP